MDVNAQSAFDPKTDLRTTFPRFSPMVMKNNQPIVELLRAFGAKKSATPAQIALAWLMAQKPWIVPIPGTTQMAHMVENSGAAGVTFTASELAELDAGVRAIEIRGQRLPDGVLVFSGVEAPPKP